MNTITIRWKISVGETSVIFSPDWERLHGVEKIDCLQDAIIELTARYNEELELFSNRQSPPNKG